MLAKPHAWKGTLARSESGACPMVEADHVGSTSTLSKLPREPFLHELLRGTHLESTIYPVLWYMEPPG